MEHSQADAHLGVVGCCLEVAVSKTEGLRSDLFDPDLRVGATEGPSCVECRVSEGAVLIVRGPIMLGVCGAGDR
jgi:hypothetical protein